MYLLGFGLAFAVCAALTPIVRRYALAHGIVDAPSSARKIHQREIAYLGGLAIFVAFVATVLVMLPMSRQLGSLLLGHAVFGLTVGTIYTHPVGYRADRPPRPQCAPRRSRKRSRLRLRPTSKPGSSPAPSTR